MGRLFDAAAGLLGVCDRMEYEAQAAMRLEELAVAHGAVPPLAHGYSMDEEGVLDFRGLLAALADCCDAAYGAALFHATLVEGLAQWVEAAAARSGLDSIAFGGGCFLNRVLTQTLVTRLSERGLRVLQACRLAPGDSAISLGQAWVAQHLIAQGS